MMLVDSGRPSNSNCLAWAESLDSLLADGDGVRLFRNFLDQEGCSSSLDFWFACQGFKLNSLSKDHDADKLHQLAKVIYKTYIRGDLNRRSMGIKNDTRRDLSDRLRNCCPSSFEPSNDSDLFDMAQSEVEAWLRTSLHPTFIKSDLYVQTVQMWGMDSLTTLESRGELENETVEGALPTLDEDRELNIEESLRDHLTGSNAAALTTANLLVTRFHRAGQSYRRRQSLENIGYGYQHSPGNPYHTSYAPASEVHSISSGQHSEDTGSRTTESISSRGDLTSVSRSSRWSHGQSRSSRRSTSQQQLPSEPGPVIPRNHGAALVPGQRRTLAESDPNAFVQMLSTRLELLSEERAKMERIQRLMEETGLAASEQDSRGALLRQPWADRLRAAAKDSPDPHAADAQAILEEHCSRIWAKSVEGSPPSDTAETGSPPVGTTQHHLHHHLHHHHHHSQSRRLQTNGSAADSASVCTLGVDSGVSLPTVLSTASSAVSFTAPRSRPTTQVSVQPTSDKVLAWIYESSEAQAQRSRSSVRSCARSPSANTSQTAPPPRPRSSSTEGSGSNLPKGGIVCGYYLSGDSVPFRCHWPESSITLGQFKELVARKCNYRFFFKQFCSEFEPGVVYEEVSNDNSPLPLWEGKVVAKLVRVE